MLDINNSSEKDTIDEKRENRTLFIKSFEHNEEKLHKIDIEIKKLTAKLYGDRSEREKKKE